MFSKNDVFSYRRIFATVEGYFNYNYAFPGITSGYIKHFELCHCPSMSMYYVEPEGSPFTIEWNFPIVRLYKNEYL